MIIFLIHCVLSLDDPPPTPLIQSRPPIPNVIAEL